ncbi:MAG: hypothetical protein JO188_10070 [Hyphomicrobiales bacterium]|nr:hypothetical protein [Hyphomicrobiales bacterium]
MAEIVPVFMIAAFVPLITAVPVSCRPAALDVEIALIVPLLTIPAPVVLVTVLDEIRTPKAWVLVFVGVALTVLLALFVNPPFSVLPETKTAVAEFTPVVTWIVPLLSTTPAMVELLILSAKALLPFPPGLMAPVLVTPPGVTEAPVIDKLVILALFDTDVCDPVMV